MKRDRAKPEKLQELEAWLRQRRAALVQQRDQHLANAQAAQGGIATIDAALEQMADTS